MKVPDLFVGKRLFVGDGKPEILGRGPLEVRGSSYTEGPAITGTPAEFTNPNPFELGATMAGQNANPEMKPFPFYAFIAKTYARIKSFLKVDKLLISENIRSKLIITEVLMAKVKNFSIPHPQKKGYNLVYSCLEGGENGVYHRGRLRGHNEIVLPEVWRDLVEELSITVSVTPIGAQQNIIVRGIQDNKIVLGSQPGIPIDCYFHVFAERKDVPRLKTEVKN
jgi:hypothetical protein